MGKLGKKARKFAKKNLQSVLKNKRKIKSMIKKKKAATTKRLQSSGQNAQVDDVEDKSTARSAEVEDFEDTVVGAVFGEDDSDLSGDDSESDGFLSEDASFTLMGQGENGSHQEDMKADSSLSLQKREIHLELAKKMKKLKKLKDKYPEFAKFLESNNKQLKASRDEESNYSDEDETSDDGCKSAKESVTKLKMSKPMSSIAINTLYQLVIEQHNVPAFTSLLNGYRAACHFGTESSSIIQDSSTFSEILLFMLRESDTMFGKILGISCSNRRKEAILELKTSSKWKTLKPLIKSYLRSTLFLLNEVADPEILAFALTRLRDSIVWFAPFRALLQRLIKISVHLWTTDAGTLSLHSFLILQDVSTVFSDCFDTCFVKAYKTFISHCKSLDPVLFKHMQFLKNSFVELCSQDMQKSICKATVSVQQLAKILQLGLQTKWEEAVKKVCSWQYANCIDLWVAFTSVNVNDYDLQDLLYMLVQIINGVATLFPGPRYLPLRVKCVQWLNNLSSSSGIFIPIVSLALDILEYKIDKVGWKPGKDFNFSSAIKLPKHWLKSQNFQEACVFSAIELLAVHFAQWSYHISFPELATVPLIRFRKFHETTTIEGFRRVAKRFIDQVEQNIEFVQKRRDGVAFSPKDQQLVESFLQLEKSSSNAPFKQYYRSVMEKAAARNMLMDDKLSSTEQKSKRKRQQLLNGEDTAFGVDVDGYVD